MSFPVSKGRQIKPRKSRGGMLRSAKPQMTSLIDILIVFLVFLIQSFSMEESVMTIPKDITLPLSSAKKPPKSMAIITVSGSHLTAGGEYLAAIVPVMKQEELMILPLYEWLKRRKEMTESIAKYSTKLSFKGEVAIEGDKEIPFALLQKIMFTCGRVGYSNFSLAVTQEEGL